MKGRLSLLVAFSAGLILLTIVVLAVAQPAAGESGPIPRCFTVQTSEAKAELACEILFSLADLSFGRAGDSDRVGVRALPLTREPGLPQLPYQVIHLVLEATKSASDVELVVDSAVNVPGQYNVALAQEQGRWGRLLAAPPTDRAGAIPGSYPAETVSIAAQGSLGGASIVTLHVFPLEYVPADGRLIFHEKLEFRIIQEDRPPAPRPRPSIQHGAALTHMLEQLVANPAAIGELLPEAPAVEDPVDYLIVTSEELVNSGVFQPLVQSKVDRGLSVRVESVTTIKSTMPGRDTAEKIRNYIKDLYLNSGLTWVLLGGDTNLLPHRWAYPGGEQAKVVCDLYFSDMDGDWDADGDGLFGEPEDQVDLYPDVFVGRASVEDEAEAQTFVDKVLTYESNAPSYADRIMLLGSEDYFDAGGRASDTIEQEYLPESSQTTKYYQRDIPCYRDRTVESLNQGYHLINLIDHGRYSSLKVGCDRLTIDDFDGLSNAQAPSIFWGSACGSAKIQYDCIAEHWLNNPNGGGAAYLGFGGYANVTVSDQMLNPEFYHSLFVDGLVHIGQTLADSKVTFIGDAMTDPAMRHDLLALNLLGDPEMAIPVVGDARPRGSIPRSPSTATLMPQMVQSPEADPYATTPLARYDESTRQVTETKLLAEDGAEYDWFGRSVSISNQHALVGAQRDDDLGAESGSVNSFRPTRSSDQVGRDLDGWSPRSKLSAADGVADDWFGSATVVNGDYALIGAYYDDDLGPSSGSVYVFEWDGESWAQQAKLTADDGSEYDYFGWSVALSENYALVGARGDDDYGLYSGSAYVFVRDGNSWTQQVKLARNDAGPYDQFGWSVSLTDDYAIVSTGSDEDADSFVCPTYVYHREGDQWTQQARLTVNLGGVRSRFGCPVSISDRFAVLGAYYGTGNTVDSGVAYVFERQGETWVFRDQLMAGDGDQGDEFGADVSLSGAALVVGADEADGADDGGGEDAGAAYVFRRRGGVWVQQAKLMASDAASEDLLGGSVSVSGDQMLVGASWDDDQGTDSGSAYVFSVLVPPGSVDIEGSRSGWIRTSYPFTATTYPVTSTLPITYVWRASGLSAGQQPITATGGFSHAVSFSWDLTGTQSITVTAANPGGITTVTHAITLTDVGSGSVVISLTDADLTYRGEDAWDWAGYSVSPAGDVNRDGYDDILIGAPYAGPGDEKGVGKTYLILGRPEYQWRSSHIDLSEADASFTGPGTHPDYPDMLGRQNYTAGDVNGDGYDDFLISHWRYSPPTSRGRAYLFLGKTDIDWGLDFDVNQADASFIGEDESDYASWYVSTAGDVNADGYDDLLITATGDEEGGGEQAGQVYLILGRPGADWGQDYDLGQSDASFLGKAEGDRAGRSATGVGDVNGDGFADFLIGAIGNVDEGDDPGQAYLFLGKESVDWGMDCSLSLADASFVGEAGGDEAGRRVAWAGDVNGDGLDDFLVGASRNDQVGEDAGKAYLFLGRSATDWGVDYPMASADAIFLGENDHDQAGRRVSGAGDVNHDGYDDFLACAPHNGRGGELSGTAYLIYGQAEPSWGNGFPLAGADVLYVGEAENDRAGYDIARAGDVDGDGIDDFLTCGYRGDENGPQSGQAYVLLSKVQELPGVPVPLLPPDGVVTSTQAVTLTWDAGPGGRPEAYNLKLDGLVITTTHTSSPTMLAIGVHNWQVRAFNDAGYSNYSEARMLEVVEPPGVPILLAPPDGTVTSTSSITFAWQAGGGADPLGYNLDLDGLVLTTTESIWLAGLVPGLHSWRVRSFGVAGIYSDYSKAWAVTVTGPIYLPLVVHVHP